VLAWLVNTAASAVIGLVVGAVVVAVVHVLPFGKKNAH
jgi:predicted DNA repair protein MutK